MTEPTDKKTRIKIDGSSDQANVDPTVKRGHWDVFLTRITKIKSGITFQEAINCLTQIEMWIGMRCPAHRITRITRALSDDFDNKMV
jgi:hypothetical protein